MTEKRFFPLLAFCSVLLFSYSLVQENTAPQVEIISPTGHTKVKWNTVVPYNIEVSDKEDGNSEYDEINGNEVVLTVTYLPDSSKVEKYVKEEVAPRAEMISFMASANCFTCHKSKNKLIGPSFEEIATKYNPTKKNKEYLTQKISNGSQGVWSDEIMPAQPELEREGITQILDWIFKNAQDPNYTFYTGTEGAFKTNKPPKENLGKATYVLHAQYIDHGPNGYSKNAKKGKHTIVLNVE